MIIGELVCITNLGILTVVNQFYKDDSVGKIVGKVAMLLYVFGFGMSLGPIVWLYIAEILPPSG